MTERLRGQIARDHLLKAATDSERMASDAEQREIEQGFSYVQELATSRQFTRWTGRSK
jgi:hypothetical protein